MKSWKKRWKLELDEKIPKLSSVQKETPTESLKPEISKNPSFFSRFSKWIRAYKKQFIACLASSMAVVLTLCIVLPHILTPTTENNTPSALMIEINPKALFSVDKDGKVTKIIASNADADLILADEQRVNEMLGKKVEDSAKIFVDCAAKLGFVDFSKNTPIRLTGYDNVNMTSVVANEIQNYLLEKGTLAVVVKETLQSVAFCERAGLPTSATVEALTQTLASQTTLYSNRVADWQSAYEEIVLQKITENVAEVWEENIADIKERLGQMYPEWLPMLDLFIENLSMGQMLDILQSMQIPSFSTTLIEVPQTVEAYTQQLQLFFEEEYASRTEKYRITYETKREKISEAEYQTYLNEVITEYGSLSLYWEAVKNN